MMLFSTQIVFILLATISGLASAGPYPSEMFYMIDCYGENGNPDSGSLFGYYQNGKSRSQNQELPDAYAVVKTNGLVTWEGKSYTSTFKWQGAGTKGTSNINGNGRSIGLYQFAGTASNSWGQQFNCYRDNERVIFPCNAHPDFRGMGTNCHSRYYCFDAN